MPMLWQAMEQEKYVRKSTSNRRLRKTGHTSPRVTPQAQGPSADQQIRMAIRKRYYGGCEYVDVVEQLAIDRERTVPAPTALTQPHSGSRQLRCLHRAAATGRYRSGTTSRRRPPDSLRLPRLTSPVTVQHRTYGIDESGKIDYDEMAKLAKEHKPKMIIGGFFVTPAWGTDRAKCVKSRQHRRIPVCRHGARGGPGLPQAFTRTRFRTLTLSPPPPTKPSAGPRGGLILAKGGDEELYKKLNSAVFPSAQGGPLMHRRVKR